jgi:ABC-type sugar transport system ATPase subunit
MVGKYGCGNSTRMFAVAGVLLPRAGRFRIAGSAARQVFHVEHDGHPAAHSLGAVGLAAAERPHAR